MCPHVLTVTPAGLAPIIVNVNVHNTLPAPEAIPAVAMAQSVDGGQLEMLPAPEAIPAAATVQSLDGGQLENYVQAEIALERNVQQQQLAALSTGAPAPPTLNSTEGSASLTQTTAGTTAPSTSPTDAPTAFPPTMAPTAYSAKLGWCVPSHEHVYADLTFCGVQL